MKLTRQNLIDAAKCENKNCLECSMLGDKKTCLDSCIAIVAVTAMELYEENTKLREELYKSYQMKSKEGEVDENQLSKVDS